MGCPACDGKGRVGEDEQPGGLLCLACDGTGNLTAARVLRAYRLGLEHGVQAMRSAMPDYETEEPMTLDRLWMIVTQEDE